MRLNVVMLGANLCNQVIFDSAMAYSPEYGSRLAPWRMVMLAVLVYLGFNVQADQEKIGAWTAKLASEKEADPDAFAKRKYAKGTSR